MTRAGSGRHAVAVAVLAALVAAAPAAAMGGGGKSDPSHAKKGGSQPFGARLVSCRDAPAIQARVAVVGAAMRPIPGATKLALRIDLYQRPLGGGHWSLRSDVPGLGSWTSPNDPSIGSRPTDVFKYRQAVGRLAVPFAYRFRVGFRWLGEHGAIVREENAKTPPCREPDLRPDLVLARVRTTPSARAGLARYVAIVRDGGRSPARAIVVAATFPGDPMPNLHSRTIAYLAPGASAPASFIGPACATGASPPTFMADPANAIDESNEADNTLAVSCPAP